MRVQLAFEVDDGRGGTRTAVWMRSFRYAGVEDGNSSDGRKKRHNMVASVITMSTVQIVLML